MHLMYSKNEICYKPVWAMLALQFLKNLVSVAPVSYIMDQFHIRNNVHSRNNSTSLNVSSDKWGGSRFCGRDDVGVVFVLFVILLRVLQEKHKLYMYCSVTRALSLCPMRASHLTYVTFLGFPLLKISLLSISALLSKWIEGDQWCK